MESMRIELSNINEMCLNIKGKYKKKIYIKRNLKKNITEHLTKNHNRKLKEDICKAHLHCCLNFRGLPQNQLG